MHFGLPISASVFYDAYQQLVVNIPKMSPCELQKKVPLIHFSIFWRHQFLKQYTKKIVIRWICTRRIISIGAIFYCTTYTIESHKQLFWVRDEKFQNSTNQFYFFSNIRYWANQKPGKKWTNILIILNVSIKLKVKMAPNQEAH